MSCLFDLSLKSGKCICDEFNSVCGSQDWSKAAFVRESDSPCKSTAKWLVSGNDVMEYLNTLTFKQTYLQLFAWDETHIGMLTHVSNWKAVRNPV